MGTKYGCPRQPDRKPLNNLTGNLSENLPRNHRGRAFYQGKSRNTAFPTLRINPPSRRDPPQTDRPPAGVRAAGYPQSLINHGRVSTGAQNLARHIDAPTVASGRRIFTEKKSGKNTAHPELWAAPDFMPPGDMVVVPSLERLGRSLQAVPPELSMLS